MLVGRLIGWLVVVFVVVSEPRAVDSIACAPMREALVLLRIGMLAGVVATC